MEEPGFYAPKHVSKPWGHEVIFGHYNGGDGVGYLGKLLHVQKGHSLSFQYHNHKTETLMVLYGKVRVKFGKNEDTLERRVLDVHTVLHIPIGYRHSIEALENSCIAEVSTPYPQDTVRINDLYGRMTGAAEKNSRAGASKHSSKRK